ncbi:MAG: 2-phospho-L-lactate transferase CofD family protein [Acidobacteriota bacterium]|nr:2-phospho-L-lactate transferase CofD family protein [Acidobacteriota bacterium]MDH3522552.1 2-phospho-L-lactate transferase CofD family protein [Acidobacteriota bacterium]
MPRVALFTGGSASNLLARSLEAAGIAATHVVSVFDNGGSTGALRRVADLPAMGDVRKRLCALASSSAPEARRVLRLFESRLSRRRSERQLWQELDALVAGGHRDTKALHPDHRDAVLAALESARHALPAGFGLADTALGNLLLLGSSLRTGSFVQAIDWARAVLGVGPRVLPVTLRSVHLGAELDDGRWLLGQAALTTEGLGHGRRISKLALLEAEDSSRPAVDVGACPPVLEAIADADAVVFGFGSFYSSVLPHLLVSGVAAAVARRPVPRVLLCNPTADRETEGMTLADVIRTVADHAGRAGEEGLRFLTHAVHFAGDGALAVPRGDVGCFRRAGGQVLSEGALLDFGAVAERATRRVRSLLPAGPPAARPAAAPGYPVVFVDLDHTLFDYGALRRGATIAALETCCREPETTCGLLLEHLAPPATLVLQELGFPDLRREWNAPAIWAWARMLDAPESRARAVRVLEDLRARAARVPTASPFEARRGFDALARSLAASPDGGEMASEALRLASAAGAPFAEQLAAFDVHLAANATLVAGARRLLETLAGEGVAAVIVTEGSTRIQRAKIEHLGLEDLATAVVVTDRTLGVRSLAAELFRHSRLQTTVAEPVPAAYDLLSRYLVKTPWFYARLVHALVAAGPHGLAAAVEGPLFLTPGQWSAAPRPRLAAVGDRYHKDLEPLLAACPRGVAAFRVVQGRYADEHPLSEIVAGGRPLPAGHFADLAAVQGALLAWVGAGGPVAARPRLLPDGPTLRSLAAVADFLSPAASETLATLVRELARHPG